MVPDFIDRKQRKILYKIYFSLQSFGLRPG